MLEKTYRPATVEARQYKKWEDAGAFACADSSGKPAPGAPFTIVMPPPNVTGSLHIGHALNHTLQDIIIRHARMRGRDALWQPGTDHAGIATQMVVERKLGEENKTRHDLGREAFLERVWKWKAESGGTITRQLRSLGASCDWRRERFTMDEGLSEAVRLVFVSLHKDGLIYRDKRLVNWDPKLHTAISDLEVEARETVGRLWHIRYPIEGEAGRFITVATTRPETMLGDVAVAVHPEDGRYAGLVGKSVVLPLVGRAIPVIADEYSDPEKSTGAVKITPAHDFNDFEVGRRHGLEPINILDENACINAAAPEAYRGLDRFVARERIVAALEADGLIDKIEDNPMTVPYGDRSGVVIEPWLTDQWYVDAATLARPAIEAVETGRTKFVPAHWSNTFFEWMRNIQPWCVSRQIWWGHRIPAWYGPDGEIFVELTEAEAAAAAKAHYGEDVVLRQETDVLDTWFSSALWPFSTLGWPEKTAALDRYYPTDVLVTSFDIIFFWVARMMMMGLRFMDEVPFHTVYIHALVRDDRGQKMSKSKGNVLDPLELIDAYGTDALRFTLAALAAQGRDIKLSDGRIEGYRNFVTKLWNAARYAEMNGCTRDPGFDPGACRETVNRWITGEVAQAAAEVDSALGAYRFNDAANALYQFIWHGFCDWYLEFTKPILAGDDDAAKAETRAATAWVLDQILILLHPIMPFVTEELWEKLAGEGAGREDLLIATRWPSYSDIPGDAAAKAEMDWIVRLISEIRAVRAEMNVPAAAKMALLHKGADDESRARLKIHDDLVRRLARASEIEAIDAVPKGAAQFVLGEAVFALPLADAIDLDGERRRLAKEIEKIDGEIEKIEKKLSNENFLAKAPEAVVAENRSRRDEFGQARAKLNDALARIAAV